MGARAPNPADALLAKPLDPLTYDAATHCVKHPSRGARLLQAWLERHWRGSSWGILRCELWGRHSASLHAEGRALDWHLDASKAADRASAQRLIALPLAPDTDGNPFALARRMGVQEVIWHSHAWFGGGDTLQPYTYCYDRPGKRKRHLDPTQAHMNHVRIGLNHRGAAGRTSFWTSALGRR